MLNFANTAVLFDNQVMTWKYQWIFFLKENNQMLYRGSVTAACHWSHGKKMRRHIEVCYVIAVT